MHKQFTSVLAALLCSLSVFAQRVDSTFQVDTTMWMVNGPVKSLVRSGNTIFLGGSFNYLGPRTGGAALLNPADGKLAGTNFEKVAGSVYASVPDGKGGWYIGGDFSRVGELARQDLAHILADGSIDAGWSVPVGVPELGQNAWVRALTLVNDTLYVGGDFTSIGGTTRNNLAALHAPTGRVLKWHPNVRGGVTTLAIAGKTLYLGGGFYGVAGWARSGLAAVDAVTGALSDWYPRGFNTAVSALVVVGNTVYAGGSFTNAGGRDRNGLAAVDARTGQVTSWDPAGWGPVGALCLAGNILYVGGSFTHMGGQSRNGLAAFDVTTGTLTPWTAKISGTYYPDPTVATIAVVGDIVYLGGNFIAVDGQPRYYLATVDAGTGRVTEWNSGANGPVYALSLSDNTLFAGGTFTSVGMQYRNGLAALDATTGEATAWNANLKSDTTFIAVHALALAGDKLCVSGNFTQVGGQARRSLAAVDTTTGSVTAWAPNPVGEVSTMAAAEDTIYLGGTFSQMSGQPRHGLAAVDLTTNQLIPWSPTPDAYGRVNVVACWQGKVYVGGHFTAMNGQPRKHLAALDGATGQLLDWNVGPMEAGGVHALAFFGNNVYVAGRFFSYGKKFRAFIGAFDASTAETTDWNIYVNDGVQTLAIADSVLFLGGDFGLVNDYTQDMAQNRGLLAAVKLGQAKLMPWQPRPSSGPGFATHVTSLTVYGDKLYVVGNFTHMQGHPVLNFAVFRRQSAPSYNYIKGTVFEDTNGDCVKNNGEKGIAGRVVRAQPGNYFSSTDSSGNYTLQVGAGSYTIEHVVPADRIDYIAHICPVNPASYQVDFTGYGRALTGKDFATQTTLQSNLTIAVSSNRRRRCFTSETAVSYCNEGTAAAQNVQVHVQLPEYVALVSAKQPFTKDQDGNYVFAIGTLAAGTCGTIQLIDSVVCNNPDIRGLTQCTRAWITPANDRTPAPAWDRSNISLKARCGTNGRVRLGIYNTGTGNMADSSAYRIYLDAQLAFTRNFKLAPGDSLILQVPANGRTVRLEADQRPAHPDKRQSNITIEGCGTNSGGTVSKGYVCQLPQDDEEPEVAVECLPIIDSFDPNDKAVSPQGVTAQHYTPTGRALDYVVRFQNTGTDVAYRVVVVDTLSEHLDISTLRVGAVSHPYQLNVSGKGRPVLTFTFQDINLPDSTADEPRSHGRIQFSIRPKGGLPEKTRVENLADIFFDYNEPVRTNTTVNTLYDLPPVVVAEVALTPSEVCPALNETALAGAHRTLCEQDTVRLAAGQPLAGNGRWKLVRGAGTIREPNRADATVTALAYGENEFEWRIPAGRCTNDSLVASVTITRRQKPVAQITQSGADQLECSLAGSRYEWFLDGVKLDKGGQRIQVTQSGRYSVRVEMPDGCHSDLSEAYAYAVTGLVPGARAAVRVFPNPTTGRLVVSLPVLPVGPVHVTVVDKIGRTVLSQTCNPVGNAGAFRVELDLSAQATGLYVLKLQTITGLYVRSVFKK